MEGILSRFDSLPKCPACGTRGVIPHVQNGDLCRDLQHDRASKEDSE